MEDFFVFERGNLSLEAGEVELALLDLLLLLPIASHSRDRVDREDAEEDEDDDNTDVFAGDVGMLETVVKLANRGENLAKNRHR